MRSVGFKSSARTRATIALAIISALSGCAVGPDFRVPESTSAATYTPAPQPADTEQSQGPGSAAQHFVQADSIGGGWWRAFGSPALDRLVQQALDDSPTLAQARMKLVQAQQDYLAQAGATQWPQVDTSLKATRSKPDPAGSGLGSLVGGRSFAPFTLYSAKVNVSYTLDLFGANRRSLEALAAQVDYQQYELDAARLSLAGNVVTTAVRRASLAKQIALTGELLADQGRQLDITEQRFHAGGVSRMDLLSQRSQVEQTRASLAPLRTQLAQADHQLAVYLGIPAAQLVWGGEAGADTLDLDAFVLPAQVPLTLRSTLAQQRPDIRASEALLHQASANVGVAIANLYPQITLSADTGPEGVRITDLVNVWSVGANLTQPLFHGGQLQAHKRSAQAAYEAALAAYRQTVLQGLQQVADALRALQQDAIELQSRDAAQRDAQASAEIASQRFAVGGLSQLGLLDTERQELQTSLDRTKV
ncbi:MAG TPA: efflux transporter outer membrane subunit, partial [Burkholderiaceae bacterium]|nr:efflux transporter outer membrane subunit [Burkholderiaceae bacterium]